MNKFSRIALKTFLWILGSIIFLLLLLIFLIRLPAVQNYIVGKVTNYLETKIGTPVDIGHINITFPKKLVLQNVYFEDQTKDTLLAGEELLVDINMFKLLKNTIEIEEFELKGITAKINRTLPDSSFNFDYIVNAFATQKESSPTADSSSALVFDIDKVNFERINFKYKDDVIGTSASIFLNQFDTRIKKFDLTKNMSFDLPVINIDGLTAEVKQWAVAQATEAPTAADFGIHDPTVEASSLLPNLATKTLNLKNILIRYSDEAGAMDTKFNIEELIANVHEIDLNKEIVRLKEVTLNQSDSEVLFGKVAPKVNVNTGSDSSSINWIVSADKLVIDKTNVWYKDDNQARTKGIDYFNLKLTELAGVMENIYYSADSISGNLTNLTAKDHSGFYLKQLQGDLKYTNQGASVNNLLIETPFSKIQDQFEITYPSLEAISTNPSLMNVQANLSKSYLDMKDVAYLVPDLSSQEVMKPLMNKRFFIDGKVSGKLDDLLIPKFEFKTLKNTHIIASGRIKGLPDIDKMVLDLQIKKMVTGRDDLKQLIAASLLPDSIQLPRNISVAGTFKGGMSGFDTDLKLLTEQGNASINGYLKMGRDTSYNAFVSVDNFNLGEFLKQDSVLGYVAAQAQVTGTGLNPKTMNADILGTVKRFDAMGYSYRDIDFDLSAVSGDIAGNISSPDPNIQLRTKIEANMKGKYPKLFAEMEIDSINFKKLKLMDQDLRYHGKIIADFETLDLDFLNGSLAIVNSSLAYNNDRFVLDSVSLKAQADSSRNTLVLQSEFLNAHLTGKYKLTELSSSITDIIHRYYNPSNTQQEFQYASQQFEFSARLNKSRIIRDFLPDLEELEDITLDGTFNSDEKSIMAKLLAPKIVYAGTEIENVGLDIISVDSTLYYNALVGRILVSNIELSNTILSGNIKENQVDLGLWIKDKLDKEQYHLGAIMNVAENNYGVSLKEDGLMLNYEKWSINPNNLISFGKDGIRASAFHLSNQGQELIIQSQDSTLNAPIDLRFNNFRIETFTKMLESENLNLGGGINGTATVSRLESSPVFISDLTINKFFFGKDTIGNVMVKVNNVKENTYSADIRITENGNDVQLIGDIISPPQGDMQIDATLALKPMKMKTIEAFSMGNLKGASGDLTGGLQITGTTSAPRILGELTFVDAIINASMLNSNMKIDGQKIFFNNQGISFKNFNLTDSKNNTARLNGTIRTQTYTDFDFNLNLTTDDFEVMNSTRVDNDLFFGKMYLTSNIRITGNLDKPKIDGNVKANERTDFNFIVPNDNPGVAQRDGVVKFVDRSDTVRSNVFAQLDSMTKVSNTLSGYDIALNLSTDREAKFKIILDEGTKDALNIRGIAEINTSIDANDKITMSGTFTVEDGDYTFSLGPISKDFRFQKGSTITWNGDPLDARLNITAVYTGRFASLELVQNQIGSESQNLYKQRVPFNVLLKLTGELFKPEINFDIDLDESNAIVSQDVVSKVNIALSNIRDDPAELNKQVFSLIALGRFMSSNPFESLSGGGAESMARSTVSSFLTGQLNNLASDLIKGVELDFNLNSEEDYLTGNAQTRTDLNVGVSKLLFDDRLKITIGSNFEVEGNSRPGEKASNIAGDISLDYQLSKDGRYFARVYRKNQYQATLQGQFVETGIGFIINMSYNRFKELFMNSKALQEYYNTESSSFRKRFDVDRMEIDSIYRDSVRTIIRDSLMKHSPEYRKRIEQQQQDLLKQQQDSTQVPIDSNQRIKDSNTTAYKNEEEDGGNDEN
ncbi:translocation/assembly module TamB domain-containing protein [Sphingobacterium sp. HJSM2_6]|uniref:translocation/assembly module TamB domain-containing protein n=1 Tax=Sphingobacterium sp. HJSM2_6 TaxID=3366264 RepID=UPI003BBC60DF